MTIANFSHVARITKLNTWTRVARSKNEGSHDLLLNNIQKRFCGEIIYPRNKLNYRLNFASISNAEIVIDIEIIASR